MTPCEKLGYNVGDKFKVIESLIDVWFEVGEVIILSYDDASFSPQFKRETNHTYRGYASLKCVEKLEEVTMSPLNKGKYVIGTIGNRSAGMSVGEVSISKKPKEHDTIEAARFEAERLALANTGTEFVVLEVKGIVSTQTTLWR